MTLGVQHCKISEETLGVSDVEHEILSQGSKNVDSHSNWTRHIGRFDQTCGIGEFSQSTYGICTYGFQLQWVWEPIS